MITLLASLLFCLLVLLVPLCGQFFLFLKLPAAEQVVVVLGKAVGLVADVLQQAQSGSVAAQPDRLGRARPVDLLLALGQGDQARRLDPQHGEGVQRRVEYRFAARAA